MQKANCWKQRTRSTQNLPPKEGSKIAELLNAADIWTFEELAFTPVARLREILDAGGSRFQIHNPETWPRQSALASVGNWKGLRAWQDVLNAGKLAAAK